MMRTDADNRKVKMLIVDDEPIICEGLRLTIDWEKYGVQVVGVAYDGEEALRMTRDHKVDIVLSDIRMEPMDGLQLTEKLKQQFPNVQVVIISGYEDFDYARQAIRTGVTDYLLKPVNIDELVHVVQNIVKELAKLNDAESSDGSVMWLAGMVNHSLSSARVAPPRHLHGSNFVIIVSQLTEFTEHYSMLSDDDYIEIQKNWVEFIHNQLFLHDIRAISVFDHKNVLYTLAMSDQGMVGEPWRQLLEKTMHAWKGASRLFCGASAEYQQLEQTAAASAEARELLKRHVLDKHAVLLSVGDDIDKREPFKSNYNYSEMVRKLATVLFQRDRVEVKTLILNLFESLSSKRLLLNEVVEVYEELLVLLRQRLRQSGLTEAEQSKRLLIDLNVNNSYNSIAAIAMEEMEQMMLLIDLQGIDKSYWVIEKAKTYMTKQYHNDIKASEVASWLKITPSYFSVIFKQSTGKSFNEYMNELRIEHAKQLLGTTHDKVFEIADKVGYKEYKYFVSVFKTYTGMTPKEFRTLNVNNV